MTKYNLTFWQRLELIPIWFLWYFHAARINGTKEDMAKLKSWHEIKKGMEKHKHKFSIPFFVKGYKFLRCEHEGCYVCDDLTL